MSPLAMQAQDDTLRRVQQGTASTLHRTRTRPRPRACLHRRPYAYPHPRPHPRLHITARRPLSFCRQAPLRSSRTCVRSNKQPCVGRTRTSRSAWNLGATWGVAKLRAAGFCGRGQHRILAHASNTREWLRLMQRHVKSVHVRALLDLHNIQALTPHCILTETVLRRIPLSMRVSPLCQTVERVSRPPEDVPTEEMQGRRPAAAGDAQKLQEGQFR